MQLSGRCLPTQRFMLSILDHKCGVRLGFLGRNRGGKMEGKEEGQKKGEGKKRLVSFLSFVSYNDLGLCKAITRQISLENLAHAY